MNAVNSTSYAATAYQLPPLIPSLLPNCFLKQNEVRGEEIRDEEDHEVASDKEHEQKDNKRQSKAQPTHDEVPVSFSGLEDLYAVTVPDWECSATSQVSRTLRKRFSSSDGAAEVSKGNKDVIINDDFPTNYPGQRISGYPQLHQPNILSPFAKVIHKGSVDVFQRTPSTLELTPTEDVKPFTPIHASDYPAHYLQYSGHTGASHHSQKRKAPEEEDYSQGGGGYQGGEGGQGEKSSGGDEGREGKPKRRRTGKKTDVACAFCRKRKLKCNGERPTCYNCDQRGMKCEYPAGPRRRGPGKKTRIRQEQARAEARREIPVTPPPQASTSAFPSHRGYDPFESALPGPPLPQYPYQSPRAPNIMIGPGMGLQHQILREDRALLPPLRSIERVPPPRMSMDQLRQDELGFPETSQFSLQFQSSREGASSREFTAPSYSEREYRGYRPPDTAREGEGEGGADEEIQDPYARRQPWNPRGEGSSTGRHYGRYDD